MIFKTISLIAALSAAVLSSSVPAPAHLENQISSLVKEAVSQVQAMDLLETKVETYLKENTEPDECWSVSVALPDSNLQFDFSGEPQTAASSIKLFLVAAVMENWDSIKIDEETLEDLAASTLIASDNEAATALTSLLGDGDIAKGKQVVNDFCKAHDYPETFMGIIFYGNDPTGTYNATTSGDLVHFLSDILDHKLKGSDKILEWMKQSERLSKIPAALPEHVLTANKTGELDFTENDSAIVFGDEETFILSIMADTVNTEVAISKIHELTELVYNTLEKGEGHD